MAHLPSAFGTSVVRGLARYSDGVRLCLSDGPASGRMMGYACRNRAGGRGPVGRWVDRRFLNFPGWEGVRRRRRATADLLRTALAAVPHAAPHVLDLAGGPADALLDVLVDAPTVSAACVDLDSAALADGATRAASLGLAGVRFEAGDALDRVALLARTPRPDVVCCTGLYELLGDDAVVRRSLATVAALLPPAGLFVVCHQSAVPPVGRVGQWLADAAAGGRPSLTPRSAATLTAWLTAVGFEVEGTADAAGLYTLALARRT